MQRFYSVLEKHDAQVLLSLSKETRSHAMKALSSLSKYLGQYDDWQKMIKRFQLKWEQKGGYTTFEKIFDENNEDYSAMQKWIKESISRLPTEYGNLIIFNTLTGLRPDESYKAVNLINIGASQYIDKERMLLLHYKFPDKFLRISKKAYLSIINALLHDSKNS